MPDLNEFWPFLAAFASLVAAGFGVPIPEEIPVIGAGIWVGSEPAIGPICWLILPVCIVGIIISDVVLYSIGRLWGPRLLEHRWLKRLMPPDKRERIESNFHHYGIKILLFVRWVPGIRSPMFITAGIMRVPLSRFIIADGIAASVGHSLLFFLAFWFGQQFKDLVERIEKEVNQAKPIIILSAIVAVAIYFLVHYLRQPVTTGDPKDVPLIGGKVAATIDSLDSKMPFLGHKEVPSADGSEKEG